MTTIETRYQKAAGLEVRAAADGAPVISGLGIVYNRTSVDLGGWVEQIDPAALTKTLQESGKVYASYNHDENWILGRVEANTLRLINSGDGLTYEIDPDPESPMARHVLSAVKRGDVSGSSFTFRVLDSEWVELPDYRVCRRVTELALYEIGPVVSPAYQDTTAEGRSATALRSLAEARGVDLEEVVRCAKEGALLDVVRHEVGTVPEERAEPGNHSDASASRLRAAKAALWLLDS